LEQITHNNHYVPQFYLKNWSDNGKTLWTYNILVSDKNVPFWDDKSISSIATLKDFYTREIDNKEIDDFEQWFNKDFETPAKITIDKVKKEKRLSADDWNALVNYAAAQYLRTPAKLSNSLNKWRDTMPGVLQKALNNAITKLEKPRFTFNQIESDIDAKLIPMKVNIDKENGILSVNSLVGKGMYLFAIKHLLTKTVDVLKKYKWHIVHAAYNFEWATSDDPVICLNYYSKDNYDFNGGWEKKAAKYFCH